MQPHRIEPVLCAPCETRVAVNLTGRGRTVPRRILVTAVAAPVVAAVVRVLRAAIRPLRSARPPKKAARSLRARAQSRGAPERPRRHGEVAAGGDPR